MKDDKIGYKYREVICGYCDHRFMWEKSSSFYYIKATGEKGLGAVCPNCGEQLAVFDGESIAIPSNLLDEDVKRGREFRL